MTVHLEIAAHQVCNVVNAVIIGQKLGRKFLIAQRAAGFDVSILVADFSTAVRAQTGPRLHGEIPSETGCQALRPSGSATGSLPKSTCLVVVATLSLTNRLGCSVAVDRIVIDVDT
jgi:hypothetical protein